MCRFEKPPGSEYRDGHMGLKFAGEGKVEKSKGSVPMMVVSRSRIKLWMIRATTTVLLWTCVLQLTALGDVWVLTGWPSCFTPSGSPMAAKPSPPPAVEKGVIPPKNL